MNFLAWDPILIITTMTVLIAILPALTHGKPRFYACYIFYFFFSTAVVVLLSPLVIFYYKDPVFLGFNSVMLRYLSPLMGITWEIRGKEKLKKAGVGIIVSNHMSCFDILGIHILHEYGGTYTSLGKKEAIYYFPWGPLAWLGGLIFVDRKCQKSKSLAMTNAMKYLNRGKHLLPIKLNGFVCCYKSFSHGSERVQWVKIWVFAEGTRNSSRDTLLPFKTGAFRMAIDCQTVIVPVVFSPYYFIDFKNKIFNRGKVIVSILDEISAKGMTSEDVTTLMTNTHVKMSDEFHRLSREVGAV